MRLLFITSTLPPADRPLAGVGGMQTAAAGLVRALGAHPGVALHVLALRAASRRYRVRKVFFWVSLLWRVPRAVARHDVGAILFAGLNVGWLAPVLRRLPGLRGVPMTSIAHGADVVRPSRLYRRVLPRVFAALDLVFPVSRATADACIARGLPPARAVVVPNGIARDRFADCADRQTGRPLAPSDAAAAGQPFRLCSVGRLVARKGFDWFAARVLPGLPEGVHLYLAGTGPRAGAIRAAADAAGVAHRVHLLGRLTDPDVCALLRSCDLFVMPNVPVAGDMEGFGIVLLEAGLCGLPVAAARLEGIVDVVREGENGVLIAPGDPDAWAEGLRRLMADRGALSAMGRQAPAFVASHFDLAAVARRYVVAVQGLCGSVEP